MKLTEAVGKRTRELLFEKNITQYKLKQLTCLTEKTISDLIKGKTNDVKFSIIFLITEALNISCKDFFDSKFFENLEYD